MLNFLKYFTLGSDIILCVSGVQAVIASGNITGPALASAVAPGIEGIRSVAPHATFTDQQVLDICTIIADSFNKKVNS